MKLNWLLSCLLVAGLAACGPATPVPAQATATPAPLPSLAAPSATHPSPTVTGNATIAPPVVASATPTTAPSPTLEVPSATPAPPVPTPAPSRTLSPAPTPELPEPSPAATHPPAATPTAAPPVIFAFTASAAETAPGQPVTLRWEAAAEWVRLTPLDSRGLMTNISISLPISGTLVVTPEVSSGSQGYILFAGAGDVYVSASVQVKIACQAAWFFGNPPSLCPLSAPHATAMAAQPFEHGLMLWVEDWWTGVPTILVLLDDGVSGRGEWQEWPDQWVAGMPEDDPALTIPPGMFQPRRGFGKLWREQAALRTRLGWATMPEAGLPQGMWQQDSQSKYSSVYLTGPGGQVYVLGPEHASWAIWTG